MSVTRVSAIGLYLLAVAIFGTIEFAARRKHSRIPTLADVCGFVLRYRAGGLPVGRIAVYGFWWWLGWHLFAR